MKKNIVIQISVLFLVLTSTSAQTYTQAFDSVFANVSRAGANTGILYERVLPFANLTNFNSLLSNPDTSNCSHFFRAANELRRATFNLPCPIVPKDSILKICESDPDLIQIGMLHFDINTFDTNMLHQKLFFDGDSILQEDTSVSGSLYNEEMLFVASPLRSIINTDNPLFYVNSMLYFDNTHDKIQKIYADFDDGLGYRQILVDDIIPVEYDEDGIKVLRFQVSLKKGATLYAYASIEVITRNPGNAESVYPYVDDYIGNNAIEAKITPANPYDGGVFSKAKGFVRVYYSNSDKILRKPLLIIDGFDPMNERQFETSTSEEKKSLWEMLYYKNQNNQTLHLGLQLLNMGYDLVMLDFPDGGTYIEQNAMVCVEVINRLNNRLKQNGSNENIVVVGPSMGGQIARYALTYMEQNSNENTNFGNHNTRLWISYDSPHQGANISIGAQYLIETFAKEDSDEGISLIWNKTLCCSAAKQMLKHHADISAHYLFDIYYNHLHAQNLTTNGYPSYLRKISVANGSINNISNGTAYQIAFQGTVYAPLNLIAPLISSPPLPFISLNIRLRNMVNSGTGEVLGFTVWIAFIPIHINKNYSNNYGNSSPDVAPGGSYDTFDQVYKALKKIPIVGALTNVSINHRTHCFMPITSTLDISGNMNYCTDISTRDLVTEGLTPFDSYTGVIDSNMEHVTFNQNIFNYLINEIETYIQGNREVTMCTSPTYTLHLPQDSSATVTWLCSDNLQIKTGNDPYTVTLSPLSLGDGWISAEVSTLKHRKRLANYPVHIISNTLPTIDTLLYSGNTLILDSTYILGDSVAVDSGNVMTVTGTLHCAPSARIIVRPGGKLVVDGGTLTSACDAEMWPGITVLGHSGQRQLAQNQGKVELLNGAVIEHAQCGVTLGADEDDTQHTGGILTATDASFLNCARAIHFRPYMDSTAGVCCRANTSSCTRCTFVVDSGNRFAQHDATFNEHVLLENVIVVRFKACSLVNVGFIGNMHNCGIRALNASFGLTDDDDGSYPPNPNTIVHRSLLSGFRYGVYASGRVWGMGPCFINTVFRNNINGAYLQNTETVIIKRSSFHLDSLPYSFVRPSVNGVYLSNCSDAKFEGDTFARAANVSNMVSRGIYADNNSMGDVIVYYNLFENLRFGIQTSGNNGDSIGGLQFACNEFLYNSNDIYIPNASTVSMYQGYRGYAAGNTFTGTMGYGIYNGGPQVMHYYNGTVGIDPSLIYGSVTQHYGAPGSGCYFSWDTILPVVPPEPIKTESDSTGDNAPQDPPKVLQMGGNASIMGAEDVVIFPNPNSGQFTINNEQLIMNSVQVYDVYGKLLKTVEAGDNIVELDVSELASGMYFVRVSTDKGVVTKSFVKK